jgi:hypothetical protein
MLTKITHLERLGGFRLRVRFSDGSEGVHDFSSMVNEPRTHAPAAAGPSFFARVFLEFGAPARPNGSDNHPDVDPALLFIEVTALREAEPAVV